MSGRPWAGFNWNHGIRSGGRSRPKSYAIPNLPSGRSTCKPHVYGGRIWLFGGDSTPDKVHSWAVGEAAWTTHANMPAPTTVGGSYIQGGGSILHGNKVIMCGGTLGASYDRVKFFNLDTKAWSTGPAWGFGLYAGTALYNPDDGCYMLFKGQGGLDTKKVQKLDPATGQIIGNYGNLNDDGGTGFIGVVIPFGNRPVVMNNQGQIQKWTGLGWTPFTTVFSLCNNSSCTEVLLGYFLVAGGATGGATGGGKKTLLVNALMGTSVAKAQMIQGRVYHSAVVLGTGNLLVVGGQTAPGGVITATAEIYDPIANTWRNVAPRPVAAFRQSIMNVGGFAVVMGGETAGGPCTNVDVFNPYTESWMHEILDPNA